MRTIHLIGNAHIDPVWLWRYQEGCQETRATFRSALDRMDEFPEFVFTCAGAAAYRWVEETDPSMFAEIRQRVSEGRWVIVGGWWVQPDCNAPSGESFARHGLYGQRYFLSRFGRRATTGYNVDSFGHSAMMPQILKNAGLDSYVMMRPDALENPDMPSGTFRWESPDGSEVITHRIRGAYAIWDRLAGRIDELADALTDREPETMGFYGVGNHGGGPTIAQLEEIRELRDSLEGVELLHSSPPVFFDSVRRYADQLQVWRSEMQHHASGCYSARSDVKRANRRCEARLYTAELWNCVASRTVGTPPAGQAIARAWENVMFNHFHDIMGGCSIHEAYADVHEGYGESLAIASREENRALQSIAGSVDTRGEGIPVIVFNPHPFPATVPFEIEVEREPKAGYLHGVVIEDGEGHPVPFQPGRVSSVRNPPADIMSSRRVRLCFVADLPAAGYRTYRVLPGTEEPAVGVSAAPSEILPFPRAGHYATSMDGRRTLAAENDRLRMEIDGRTGWMSRLFDKIAGVEVLSGPGAVPVVLEDRSDTWSHGVFAFREEAGKFSDAEVSVIEEGPVRTVVRAVSSFGMSRMVQEFILWAGTAFVDVRVKIDWRERLRILKLAFPAAVSDSTVTCEIPFGAVERPADGNEESFHRWLDVTGNAPGAGRYGLTVINDGCASADVLGSEIRMTVLRSAVHAHHTPNELVDGEEYAYLDQGEHELRYRILPHSGDWRDAGAVRAAILLNAPPVGLVEYRHGGTLPPVGSFVSADCVGVQVTALKFAEESLTGASPAVILRAAESHGRATDAEIDLAVLGRRIKVTFGPWEIKTLRIPVDVSEPVTETNFLEE